MNKDDQRIAIATACGWTSCNVWAKTGVAGEPPGVSVSFGSLRKLPRYLTDLNAMHEAEKVLTGPQRSDYHCHILALMSESVNDCTEERLWNYVHATAAQRAEAFLKTLDKWTETD